MNVNDVWKFCWISMRQLMPRYVLYKELFLESSINYNNRHSAQIVPCPPYKIQFLHWKWFPTLAWSGVGNSLSSPTSVLSLLIRYLERILFIRGVPNYILLIPPDHPVIPKSGRPRGFSCIYCDDVPTDVTPPPFRHPSITFFGPAPPKREGSYVTSSVSLSVSLSVPPSSHTSHH